MNSRIEIRESLKPATALATCPYRQRTTEYLNIGVNQSMNHLRRLFVLALAVFLIGIVPAFAQTQIILPDLTGSYAVSRTQYDLTDFES